MNGLASYTSRVLEGESLTTDQIREVLADSSLEELCAAADLVRKTYHGDRLYLCSIVNARSGMCSEDCKFCAQSSWHHNQVATYDKVELAEVLRVAADCSSYGISHLSLVTAGRSLSFGELEGFGEIYQQISSEYQLKFCASMGLLTSENAHRLGGFGVTRYHCNLEASKSFFPELCTTHTWEEKVATIKNGQGAGLEICSGGIIGMGESQEQRVELAFELKELGIRSIPINILTPIPDTPLGTMQPLSTREILTSIALFRLINPHAVIRIAGGRGLLGKDQKLCFTAGANGAIVGNYLTTAGQNIDEDIQMFRTLGFTMV